MFPTTQNARIESQEAWEREAARRRELALQRQSRLPERETDRRWQLVGERLTRKRRGDD